MKRIRIIGMCLVAAFAFSAVAASSALASPEFLPVTGAFPKNFTSLGGVAKLATVNSEVECETSLDRGTILPIPTTTSSMLGDVLFQFHKCVLTKAPGGIGVGTACTGILTGEKSGLITTPTYLYHVGSLVVLGNGKKDVLILVLVTTTQFTCDNGIVKVTVSGNLVGVAPEETLGGAKQFNKIISSLEIEFKQIAAGKQEFTEFEFTLPAIRRTSLTLLSNAGFGNEEASENASGTETIAGGETVRLDAP